MFKKKYSFIKNVKDSKLIFRLLVLRYVKTSIILKPPLTPLKLYINGSLKG